MADQPKRAAPEKRAQPPADEPTFDARLARLEAIVSELEGGGLPLESSIDRYQEGVALLRDCRSILAGFQKRVEELSADPSCEPTPYAHDPDARA
jgi:exodeoxyribonuclease VII small subunit